MSHLEQCYNIADLREVAQRRLPKGVFEYLDRGSEDEVALAHNRRAYDRLKLRTRVLVDLRSLSTEVDLLGGPSALPLAIAPTGIAGLCSYEGELALAKAAAQAVFRSLWPPVPSPLWKRSPPRPVGDSGSS